MNKNIIYIAITALLIIGFLAMISTFRLNKDNDTENGETPTPTVTPEVTATSTPTVTPNTTVQAIIDENWVEYSNDSVGFSIEHPEEMEVNDPPIGGVAFTYWGPTQEEATELHDGINVTISRTALPDRFNTLEEYARDEMENAQENGELVESLEEITVNGNRGYSFTVESLGVITHLILEHSDDMTLYVTYLSPDPGERGYRQVVERMLATLEI